MRAILAAALAAFLAIPAQAQECLPRDNVLITLAAQYGEEIVDSEALPGRADPSVPVIYEVWANGQTGSWTFTARIEGNPIICVLTYGEGYHDGITVRALLFGGEPA